MKSDCSAPSWLKFFSSAGIQKDSAETYAVTFSKNQIQLDMLPEIKKEYLVDMGITLMGHIIAILRHAKTVHTEEVTKSTLSTNKTDRNGPIKTSAPPTKPVSKTTPIMVKEKVTPTSIVDTSSTVQVQPSIKLPTVKPSTSLQSKSSRDSPILERRKDKQQVPEVSKSHSSSAKQQTISRPVESPPKRKLTAEESGNPDESEAKKKIFQRLGHVSSSNASTDTSVANGESVFSRLGNKTLVPTIQIIEPAASVQKKVTVKPIVSLLKPSAPSPVDIMKDPKKKVMMLNQGVLTKTMRADQDTPSKIVSLTSLSADHTSQTLMHSRLNRNNIYLRLGKAAMDEMPTDRLTVPSPVSPKMKKVSFGGVIEKAISPIRQEKLSNSFSGWSNNVPLDSPRYRRRQQTNGNGVFSRLGI